MYFLSRAPPTRQVTLLDRKLGILNWTCILLVLGYVVGVRIILYADYNMVERSYGVVGMRLAGTTWSTNAQSQTTPHDVASLVHFDHAMEGNALFLPTRWVTVRDQQLGNCTNPDERCAADSDCAVDPPLAEGLCNHQRCTRHAWCNPGGQPQSMQPSDPFASGGAVTGEEKLAGNFSRLQIVLTATIDFPGLAKLGAISESALSTEDANRDSKVKWTLAQVWSAHSARAPHSSLFPPSYHHLRHVSSLYSPQNLAALLPLLHPQYARRCCSARS